MLRSFRLALFALALLLPVSFEAAAQTVSTSPPVRSLEVYGFVNADFGFNFNSINPDWFDVMRPSQLSSFQGEFGRNGTTFAGVRQTRFTAKGIEPTKYGELKTLFEWELFGVGRDAGQTTFRVRHAYGEIGRFGAGQTWSPFMDNDVFPITLDYSGPNGTAKFRNVQVRWMPIQGDTRLTFALERPGSTHDPGRLEDRIEIANIRARFPYPDLSGEFRWGGKRGYVEAAGIIGQTRLDDGLKDGFNLDGTVNRWGINLTSNVKAGAKDVIRLGYVFGDGMENYINDAPVDIAPAPNFRNPARPIRGEALPFRGLTAFYEHYWNDRWSSTAGYSQVVIDNSVLQKPSDFHRGQYSIANLLYCPAESVRIGAEMQWGRRTNFSDGFRTNDYKLQISFKFNFRGVITGTP